MSLSDTSPETQRRLNLLYRSMTPEQKLERALSLTALVQELALSRIRAEHPKGDASAA